MSQGTWPRYPPCASGSCTDPICCSHGRKFTWPELLGKNGQVAKATIEKDNPEVTVEIITPGRVGFPDFCCNRVYLVLDNNGNVTNMPTVG
ncbi:proteinase inhibitor-like [Durio zibethinus]|uniref:Proteinase inhibitor-like n=1 Tax=Durio zibethinus TaxID=66656 RepID=A0A6P6AIT5_DURZI|nr:proteinase inhibitor-like [Durio zibethinus]